MRLCESVLNVRTDVIFSFETNDQGMSDKGFPGNVQDTGRTCPVGSGYNQFSFRNERRLSFPFSPIIHKTYAENLSQNHCHPSTYRAIYHQRAAHSRAVRHCMGVRRHGRAAIDSYCHSNCLDALVTVTLPLSLPAANPLLHRYGTTCREYGIIRRKVDYMELYRIVDFQEHQSLLQQFCGLKTVRILSMDRNTPRLDLSVFFP